MNTENTAVTSGIGWKCGVATLLIDRAKVLLQQESVAEFAGRMEQLRALMHGDAAVKDFVDTLLSK